MVEGDSMDADHVRRGVPLHVERNDVERLIFESMLEENWLPGSH